MVLQRDFGSHFFSVGAYGLSARIYTDDEDRSLGTDRFRDFALDGEYHFTGGDHLVSVHATRIREKQKLDGAFAAGLASNPTNTLRTTRADVHYWYKRTIGGGFGVFSTTGSEDQMRYNMGEAVHGSVAGSPNTRGWMLDLNYLPVQNVKLALRYTSYSKFNGAVTNYDGRGGRGGARRAGRRCGGRQGDLCQELRGLPQQPAAEARRQSGVGTADQTRSRRDDCVGHQGQGHDAAESGQAVAHRCGDSRRGRVHDGKGAVKRCGAADRKRWMRASLRDDADRLRGGWKT